MTELKISFSAVDRTARWALAIHKKIDGKEFCRPLLFDAPPSRISPEFLAAAGIILSGKKCGFTCEYPLPVAFKNALVPLGIHIVAPNKEPEVEKNIMATKLLVHAGVDLSDQTPSRDCSLLVFLPSERFQGRLRGIKELVVASNAAWISSVYGPRALLAGALIFASDLLAESLVVPGINRDPNFDFYVELLELTGLHLTSGPEGNLND